MEHEEKGSWKDIPAIVDMLNMGLTEEKDGKTKLDILFEQVEQASFSVGYYESFKKATGCTLRTILTLCQAHLQSFIDRQKEEILLDSFMDEKTVLFINRGHRETQAVDLSALLYAQLCAIAENRAENDISSAYSVSIFIDDLATHETIPTFCILDWVWGSIWDHIYCRFAESWTVKLFLRRVLSFYFRKYKPNRIL